MRTLLFIILGLVTVGEHKVLASDFSDRLSFEIDRPLLKNSKRQLFISKEKFSQDMAQLVDSIGSISNVRELDQDVISFDAIGVNGARYNNIQCSMGITASLQAFKCTYVVINFSNCGSDEVVFEYNNILIVSTRIAFSSFNDKSPRILKNNDIGRCPVPPASYNSAR